MKKAEQIKINKECDMIWEKAIEEFRRDCRWNECKRLCTMSAYVYETESFYILRSYETLIACIEKATDTCVDMLRGVYRYTATSAKHVSRFRHSSPFGGYGSGKWGCEHELTYREV